MSFQKAFPHRTETSAYPNWKEVELSEEKEKEVEEEAREHNVELMEECIEDAKKVFVDKNMEGVQRDVISMAKALFEKRASHQVYWKENAAKEKFDEKFKNK